MVKECFELIEGARKRNIDIAFDLYPYEASWTGLSQVIPAWTYEGGHDKTIERIKDETLTDKIYRDIYEDYKWKSLEDEWEGSKKMLVLNGENCENYAGKTIYEIANELNIIPIKAVIKVLLDTNLSTTCAFFGMKDEDIKSFLKSPYCMIGSDSIASKVNRSVHPRNNGTFPRVLGKYAREEQAISMEEAVKKMTGYPAQRFNFSNRGLIKEGFFADLVIFDENTVNDKATYTEPFNKPVGIDYVIVNGCISIKNGEFTGKINGQVLRKMP
jgi:N-acyl-D-amino-acid deacylase